MSIYQCTGIKGTQALYNKTNKGCVSNIAVLPFAKLCNALF